jgi:hypothetical protein
VAAPTFTSITPDVGHPGGRYLVRIIGSSFRPHPTPPATGYVGGDLIPSMEVEIDGRQASDVRVYSTTELTCNVPAFRRDPALLETGLDVDVVLRNLDPVEETTIAAAFKYQRVNLARGRGVLAHVVATLIDEIRRQVIDNVALSTDVDYDSDTGDLLSRVELAKLPGVALFGPDIRWNNVRREQKRTQRRDVPANEYEKFHEPDVVDIGFSAVVVANGSTEFLNLVQGFHLFFRRTPELVVDRDADDPNAGTVEIDLFLTDPPNKTSTANAGDTHSAGASLELRGVPLDEDDLLRLEYGTILDDPADVEISSEQKG